jgi:hypothetical protein
MSELIVADPQLVRAELDVQITTAKAYPRQVKGFAQNVIEFATLDEETAEACFYKLERKDRKTGKTSYIEGPSIRLAEIARYFWGNIHTAKRIVENNGRFVTAQGAAWDLENNNKEIAEVQRSVLTRDGKTFSQDMQVVTANAAASIALRNSLLSIIPRAFISPAYEAAKRRAIGDVGTQDKKARKLFDRFEAMGIKDEKILAYLGIKSIKEITIPHIETLIGIGTSIKDGMISLESAFSMDSGAGESVTNLNSMINGANDISQEAKDYFQE